MDSSTQQAIRHATALLDRGGYTCVLGLPAALAEREGAAEFPDAADGLRTSTQRGVRPLIGLLDAGADVRGWCAADKVVGNGAAFLYVLLGVAAVHAKVMSEPARATLAHHGVAASFDELVPQIQNRAKDGLCPMEQAVREVPLDCPLEALAALRAKLAEMTA